MQTKLNIFNQFVNVRHLGIDPNSVEKRNPPEPSFLCRKANGEFIAFEMLECLDKFLTSSIYDSCRLVQPYEEVFKFFCEENADDITSKHSGALINIVFKKNISFDTKLED